MVLVIVCFVIIGDSANSQLIVSLSLSHVHNFNINIDAGHIIWLFRFMLSFVTHLIIEQLGIFPKA